MEFLHDRYYADDLLISKFGTVASARPTLNILNGTEGAGYESNMRRAFEFVRRNADRRYSARTLQRILNSADTAERQRTTIGQMGVDSLGLPSLITLSFPMAYDDETEVKTGGMAAAGILFPGDDGRVVLAVSTHRRRESLGSVLLKIIGAGSPSRVSAYVNQTNYPGQQFLLANEFMPVSISTAGTVCYSNGREDPEQDDSPLVGLARLRQPRAPRFQAEPDDGDYDDDEPREDRF